MFHSTTRWKSFSLIFLMLASFTLFQSRAENSLLKSQLNPYIELRNAMDRIFIEHKSSHRPHQDLDLYVARLKIALVRIEGLLSIEANKLANAKRNQPYTSFTAEDGTRINYIQEVALRTQSIVILKEVSNKITSEISRVVP